MYATDEMGDRICPRASEPDSRRAGHILALQHGKERLLDGVAALARAFALAVPADYAISVRDDVAFFQAVRAALAKNASRNGHSDEDMNSAIRQIVAGYPPDLQEGHGDSS